MYVKNFQVFVRPQNDALLDRTLVCEAEELANDDRPQKFEAREDSRSATGLRDRHG